MISLVVPCYNNPKALELQFAQWREYPKEVIDNVHFVLVDDCSATAIDRVPVECDHTLLRVDTDIKWNVSGARNLGYMHAKHDWIFTIDVDHTVPIDTMEKTIAMDKEEDTLYFYIRMWEDKRLHWRRHILTFHRDVWSDVHGYDEDFAGRYGHHDSMFFFLVKECGYKFTVTNQTVIVHNEYTGGMGEDPTTNRQLFKAKQQEVADGTYEHPKICNFDWHEVTHEMAS